MRLAQKQVDEEARILQTKLKRRRKTSDIEKQAITIRKWWNYFHWLYIFLGRNSRTHVSTSQLFVTISYLSLLYKGLGMKSLSSINLCQGHSQFQRYLGTKGQAVVICMSGHCKGSSDGNLKEEYVTAIIMLSINRNNPIMYRSCVFDCESNTKTCM